jgi:excisionase family DNA binding protein
VDKRYLTPSEVASELRVSTDTVLRLIDRGDLPAIRVSERIYRIPAPAFARYERGAVSRRRVARRQASDIQEYGAGEDVPRTAEADLVRS